MKKEVDNSRVITPFLPSLFHLATVKVALEFHNNFDFKTLKHIFRSIQKGKPIPLQKNYEDSRSIKCQRTPINRSDNTLLIIRRALEEKERLENRENQIDLERCNRAKEVIRLLPEVLQTKVREAVYGLHYESENWKINNFRFLYLQDEECKFQWRSDGSVDGAKTAEQLVLNANIDISKRFKLACMYCLIDSIQILWAEIEANGEVENIEKTTRNSMVRFWIRWLHDESRMPWKRAARNFFSYSKNCRSETKFRAFLPELQPEERKRFLFYLTDSPVDDLRTCLYSMTKEEEEEILSSDEWCPHDLLYSYLRWPLQSQFLETAEKMMSYLNENTFPVLLKSLIHKKDYFGDFDYSELLADLWDLSPNHLQDAARDDPYIRRNIDSLLDGIRRKRKAKFDTLINKRIKV